MDQIKALLFDVDGTILDTREYIFQAAEYALAENGHAPVPRERIAEAVGMSFDDFYFHILGTKDIDPLPFETAHRIFQLENIGISVPYPNAVETLTELKKRGYKLAAVTNRWRTTLIPTLDGAGMTHLFNEIIAPDDAPVLKPSPVPLQIALQRMGHTEKEAAMIGDTDMDIEAGQAAGVMTVRVWYGFLGPHAAKTTADHSIEGNISELLELFP